VVRESIRIFAHRLGLEDEAVDVRSGTSWTDAQWFDEISGNLDAAIFGIIAEWIAKGGAMEYLVVKYAGNDCGVIIDDVTGDWMTNEVSWVSAGHHVVRLSMPAGSFTPAQIAVELNGTSPQHPKTIQFFQA
jgi:hypothetical protein